MVEPTKHEVWKCPDCQTYYLLEEAARSCNCRPLPCTWEGCDLPRALHSVYCDKHQRINWDHQRRERLMAAEVVEYQVDRDSPVCYGDTWYFDIEDLVEALEDPRECDDWAHTSRWQQFGVNLLEGYNNEVESFDCSWDESPDWSLSPELEQQLRELEERINRYLVEQKYGAWVPDRRYRFDLRQQVLEHLKEDEDEA